MNTRKRPNDPGNKPRLSRGEIRALNRQAWAEAGGTGYAAFHEIRERLIEEYHEQRAHIAGLQEI